MKTNPYVIDRLKEIAGNNFKLGNLLYTASVGGPTIESSLATIAISQEALGHGRVFLNIIKKQTGETFSEEDVIDQAGINMKTNPTWMELIGIAFSVTAANNIVLENWFLNQPEVMSKIKKVVEEEREHLGYLEEWGGLLISQDALKTRVQNNFNSMEENAKQWLARFDNEDMKSADLAIPTKHSIEMLEDRYEKFLRMKIA